MLIHTYGDEAEYLCSLISDWWANRTIHERADGLCFDAFARRLLARTRQVTTSTEYAEILREELWALGDGHLRVAGLPHASQSRFSSNIGFVTTDDDWVRLSWLSDDRYRETPARPGDALCEINGLPPDRYFASVRLAPGSSSWHRRWLAISSLTYQERFPHEEPPSHALVLEAETGATYPLHLVWTLIDRRQAPPACIAAEACSDDIGYLALHSFYCRNRFGQVSDEDFYDQLVSAVERLGDARDLIIDLRWNGGGRDEQAQMAAAIFGKTPIEWFRYCHHGPDRPAGEVEPRITHLDPEAPWLSLRTVAARPCLLTSPATFSTAEVFAAALRNAFSAICIGDRSGGGAGNPIEFRLPYSGLTITIPVSEIYMAGEGGKPIETNGLEPDIVVRPSAADLRAGSNPAREAATRAILAARRPERAGGPG